MNERILELAVEAGYEKDMFGIGHWDMPECKKFAELIVQECVEVVKWTPSVFPNDTIIKNIKEHFGVE
jgi:CTP:phosphocholine cytidylyltransferase-like protein